jgi:hypothetical protein
MEPDAMKTPSAPPPPDPKATAQAQGQMNRETAITQANLNMVDQNTPDGSLKYEQVGSWADGTPRYQATQTYSPAQQALYDTSNKTQQKIGEIGLQQADKIGGILGSPVNLNNEATEARLFGLGRARLDPKFAQDEESLRTRLINQGLRAGTEAWDREFNNFNQSKNDAYNQLLLTGRGQAVQEALTERNQPINEISALMSGSQVSNPNFVNTPQTQVAGVDYAGLVRDNYNAQVQQANSKQQSNNAMMGGLFGLAAAPFQMFKFSDRRLKTDIQRVGKLDNGLPVYLYRYKGDPTPQMGVMAQEVERRNPDAVTEIGGFKAVDYDAAVEG